MEGEKEVQAAPAASERSPRTHVDSSPLPTDSMVTVPLSETDGGSDDDNEDKTVALPQLEITTEEKRRSSRPDSTEIMQAFGSRRSQEDAIQSPTTELDSPTISLPDEEEAPRTPTRRSSGRGRSDSNGSDNSAHVDWTELEKTEQQEPQREGQDEVLSPLVVSLL